MQKITPDQTKTTLRDTGKKSDPGLSTPKIETVSFLRQFARTYHIESRLPASLEAMVLN